MKFKGPTLLKKVLIWQNKGKYTHPILLFSDPRGGSTWLAEMFNHIPNSFIIWEPLYLFKGSKATELRFGWRQHIPTNDEWIEAKSYFEKLLSMEDLNYWNLQKASIKDILNSNVPIIKFCRGNDLLPWLAANFNFELPPVYLVRHPMAVAASQLKQGGWDNVSTKFNIPEMKFNEKYVEHSDFLATINSKEEALIATWCLSNQHRFDQENWLSLFYEDLLSYPESIMEKLFQKMGLEIPNHLPEIINRRSSTNVDFHDGMSSTQQLSKWKEFFTGTQINNMQRILDYFNIKYYSKLDVLPDKSVAKFGANHIQ